MGVPLKLVQQDILIPVLEVLMIVALRKCFIQLLDKLGPSLSLRLIRVVVGEAHSQENSPEAKAV